MDLAHDLGAKRFGVATERKEQLAAATRFGINELDNEALTTLPSASLRRRFRLVIVGLNMINLL
jgi:RNase H-fold protein (predicted Holliday junction resolvase)